MKKLLFIICPLLILSGCKSIPTSIGDAFPFSQPEEEPLYFAVDRCSDDMIEFFENKKTNSASSEELAVGRALGERYAIERMNCVDPVKYEKLELSDRCRYRNDGRLECAGSVEWILDPANYKVREGAIQERERIREQFETVEIRWEYINKKGHHISENTTVNLAQFKDKLAKLKKDKRCTVQRKGKKLVCKMPPPADFLPKRW